MVGTMIKTDRKRLDAIVEDSKIEARVRIKRREMIWLTRRLGGV
jgi:hypothetical protein